MRRAAISKTNNVAEGHGRWHYQEDIQFCRTSRGSIEEIIDGLNICEDEQYAEAQFIADLNSEAYDLIHRINSYIAYLRKTKQGAQTTNH